MAEMEFATLPEDTAGAVRALADYPWRSPRRAAAYESIRSSCDSEVLDAQFAGMAQRTTGRDPAAMQAVKDMLADLNELLAKHARGEDTTDTFARVHGRATATCSPSSPRTSTSWSTRSPAVRQPQTG